MVREIPAIRILPMSDKIPGFRGRGIEDVQKRCFLTSLPAMKGRYRYRSTGLNGEPGTVVLFQFRARIIASGVFLRDDKFEKPKGPHGGMIFFDPRSFRTFDPLDAQAMRKVWPSFRAFGHVKQFLNPTLYSQFKRRLKNVKSPATPLKSHCQNLRPFTRPNVVSPHPPTAQACRRASRPTARR